MVQLKKSLGISDIGKGTFGGGSIEKNMYLDINSTDVSNALSI